MRFTIRDLLWLMVVVGMGFAWWADHRDLQSRTKESIGLIACESLVGRERADIVAFLGGPEWRVVSDTWFYWAGTGKEDAPVWLELQFNNDRVVQARHRIIPKRTLPSVADNP